MNIVRENDMISTSKYNIGDTVYLVKTVAVIELCSHCGGVGIVDGNICPLCNGNNTISRTAYVPITTPATVKEIKVSVKEQGEIYKYILNMDGQKFNRVADNIFDTLEAAMKYCAKKNVKKARMKIDDIKILGGFLKTYPCPEKIEKRMQELRTTGTFENMVEVNEDGVLIDGYTTYVLAKGFGWKEIDVIIHTK